MRQYDIGQRPNGQWVVWTIGLVRAGERWIRGFLGETKCASEQEAHLLVNRLTKGMA